MTDVSSITGGSNDKRFRFHTGPNVIVMGVADTYIAYRISARVYADFMERYIKSVVEPVVKKLRDTFNTNSMDLILPRLVIRVRPSSLEIGGEIRVEVHPSKPEATPVSLEPAVRRIAEQNGMKQLSVCTKYASRAHGTCNSYVNYLITPTETHSLYKAYPITSVTIKLLNLSTTGSHHSMRADAIIHIETPIKNLDHTMIRCKYYETNDVAYISDCNLVE